MKLISFMAEVETDGLGVSCKFFSITYSTFGSVNNPNVYIIIYVLLFVQVNCKNGLLTFVDFNFVRLLD